MTPQHWAGRGEAAGPALLPGQSSPDTGSYRSGVATVGVQLRKQLPHRSSVQGPSRARVGAEDLRGSRRRPMQSKDLSTRAELIYAEHRAPGHAREVRHVWELRSSQGAQKKQEEKRVTTSLGEAQARGLRTPWSSVTFEKYF